MNLSGTECLGVLACKRYSNPSVDLIRQIEAAIIEKQREGVEARVMELMRLIDYRQNNPYREGTYSYAKRDEEVRIMIEQNIREALNV